MVSMDDKWDKRFLDLAEHIGGWSKDPSTKVGAVIVRHDRTIASVGYNGYPRFVGDDYTTRDEKLLRTVHAEMNAILSAREPLDGYTLYVSPLYPCSNCAAVIIQTGITTVVARMGPVREEWRKSFEIAGDMFRQAEIETRLYPTE